MCQARRVDLRRQRDSSARSVRQRLDKLRARPDSDMSDGRSQPGTPIADLQHMTISELQSIPCFQGWLLVPRRGGRRPLTARERQILNSVLDGRTHKEVAFDLGISHATVRALYSRAMRKLGRARNRPSVDQPEAQQGPDPVEKRTTLIGSRP
jgi:DNA-binding NarL/FixJ family response regulator